MAKMKNAAGDPPAKEAPQGPSARSLAALVALGALSALWALFLWAELLLARQGGTPFCALGEGKDCAALWSGPFASAIHKLTRVPIAGWGLAWSLVATAFPLLSLVKKAEGRVPEGLVSTIRLVAGAGAASLVVLIAVSAAEKVLCLGCVGTYLLVGGYAAVALYGWRGLGFADASAAVRNSAVATIVAFLVLLYPGMKTPRDAAEASVEAIRQAKGAKASDPRGHGGHPRGAPGHGSQGQQAAKGEHDLGKGPGTGDPRIDEELRRFVESLPPNLKQVLADSLFFYNAGEKLPMPKPRALVGPKDAPVRITEWTDIFCPHCAQLHTQLKEIRQVLPQSSFAIEPRHFPLDGSCNPHVERKNPQATSCVAAGVQICMEGSDKLFDLASSLFERQRELTPELIYGIAERYVDDVEALKRCVESPETKKKLEDDLALAMRFRLEGTPLVVLNGQKGVGFGPFLYAMILTKGQGKHPAFADLPAPNPHAHMH